MLEVKGWDNLDKAFEELERECEKVVRGILVFTWNSILTKTPQRFGGLAASWNWTLNPADMEDRSDSVPDPYEQGYSFYKRGNSIAISIANASALYKDLDFKLGQKVYFTNGADHGEGQYAGVVETWDASKLRAVNRPGKMVARTLDRVNARFSGGVGKQAAARLKELRIGYVSADS